MVYSGESVTINWLYTILGLGTIKDSYLLLFFESFVVNLQLTLSLIFFTLFACFQLK